MADFSPYIPLGSLADFATVSTETDVPEDVPVDPVVDEPTLEPLP
jgi:hypothetical protein